jgi:UDP-N-acetylmuramate dehydrogenase
MKALLALLPAGVDVHVIGKGSNLLVRDGGIAGVVMRLEGELAEAEASGQRILAGAGVPSLRLADSIRRAGIAGFEFLVGVPGTLGGAIAMNAGAHGQDTSGVFVSCRTVDRTGKVHEWSLREAGFGYRRSAFPSDHIIVDAVLEGERDEPEAIKARMKAFRAERSDAQPVGVRTGGSTFKNPRPQGSDKPRRAWELIDKAGCRGLRVGGAQVSEKHCNFLINLGDATAEDFETLGETVRRRVAETTGVHLEWEIRRLGVPATHMVNA